MSKTPVANYSPENVITMKSVYGSAKTDSERKEAVSSLAKEIGKTVNSIRAKLSKMGIYVKPKPVSKDGSTSVRKADLINQISKEVGENADLMGSLDNSTKFVLEKIMGRFLVLNHNISDLEAE